MIYFSTHSARFSDFIQTMFIWAVNWLSTKDIKSPRDLLEFTSGHFGIKKRKSIVSVHIDINHIES